MVRPEIHQFTHGSVINNSKPEMHEKLQITGMMGDSERIFSQQP